MFGFTPTSSMEPTIRAGSFFIGYRQAYKNEAVQRGDIVAVKHCGTIYVKRVIGLGGETLSFVNGQVLVDGAFLDEGGYLPASAITNAPVKAITVPEGCVYLMGDDRRNSYDSRYWDTPFVTEDQIIGKCLFWVSWPEFVYRWTAGYSITQIVRALQAVHIVAFIAATVYWLREWYRSGNRAELGTGRLIFAAAFLCGMALRTFESFIPR